MFKGMIHDVFGEIVGKYWANNFGTIDFVWHGVSYYGYTEQGLRDWAERLEYYLMEA